MRNPLAPNPPTFAALVQQFFTEYLGARRSMSPQTVASYRDAFRLFLDFAHHHLGKEPMELSLLGLDAPLILAFLDHLEQDRHNAVRSRNLRLTALRAFLTFAARRDVTAFQVIQQALGVPMKRFAPPLLGFRSREEMRAIIGEPGNPWTSRRDHLLFTLLYNTGARVSEIIGCGSGMSSSAQPPASIGMVRDANSARCRWGNRRSRNSGPGCSRTPTGGHRRLCFPIEMATR
jgi:site-specific recombinase XerD